MSHTSIHFLSRFIEQKKQKGNVKMSDDNNHVTLGSKIERIDFYVLFNKKGLDFKYGDEVSQINLNLKKIYEDFPFEIVRTGPDYGKYSLEGDHLYFCFSSCPESELTNVVEQNIDLFRKIYLEIVNGGHRIREIEHCKYSFIYSTVNVVRRK